MLLIPGVAGAWKRQAEIGARVHGHAFHHVSVETDECRVRVRLDFNAPPEAYPKSGRGYYRFKARIKLTEGRAVVTPVFGNGAPGQRSYTATWDSSAEGCWAKEEHKLIGVDVEGCRGKTCTPQDFP